MIIESLDEWITFAARLFDEEFSLWQMQYHIEHPEGFQARFYAPGRKDIEVITHSAEVHDAILKFKSLRSEF
jgi:hypothetical protein